MTDIIVKYYPEWGPPKPVLYPNIFTYSVSEDGVLKMNTCWEQTLTVPLHRVRSWRVRDIPEVIQ